MDMFNKIKTLTLTFDLQDFAYLLTFVLNTGIQYTWPYSVLLVSPKYWNVAVLIEQFWNILIVPVSPTSGISIGLEHGSIVW